MSFLLTSLILCLFQTPQPELSLKESEGAYTKAMHLIDVRGKYLEGAEILESIADAEDVIWFPGQSSWILAQAARAFTLAGKPELASMDLDLIRDASRGTRFEEPVQELLLTFAAEGAGLDGEFLAFILQYITSRDGAEKLVQEYRRDLLPYLRHFVDSPSKYGLHSRLQAMGTIFTMMTPSYEAWATKQFQGKTFWSGQVLPLLAKPKYNPTFFLDSEARESFASFLLQISDPSMGQHPDSILDASLEVLSWWYFDGTIPLAGKKMELVKGNALRLIEEGHRGKRDRALLSIARRWGDKLKYWREMGLFLAEHEDRELRNQMRMELARVKGTENWIRQWAVSGELEDELRFCFSHSRFSKNVFSGSSIELTPEVQWIQESLRQSFPEGNFGKLVAKKTEPEDYETLASLKNTKHPLVRFLAASSLNIGAQREDAMAFLSTIGDDSQWAQYFLSPTDYTYTYDLEGGRLAIMLDLLDHPELGPRAREIVSNYGGPGMSTEIWEQYEITPSSNSLIRIRSLASEQHDEPTLLWLTLNGEAENDSVQNAARSLATDFPMTYLNALEELADSGRREFFPNAEHWAWVAAGEETSGSIFSEKEEDFEWFLFHGSFDHGQANSFDKLATYSMHLALQMAMRHQDNIPAMRALIKTPGARRILYSDEYAEESTEFVLNLMQGGLLGSFDHDISLLQEWISLDSELAPPIFEYLWEHPSPTRQIIEYRIRSTAKSPALRDRFHDEMVRQLQDSRWTKEVSSAYMYAGATEEILDACLDLLHSGTTVYICKNLIETISKVDDPRVIETLLSHLNDPRQGVPEAASEGLDYLRKLRTQKQEWSAWAAGNGAVSPIAALLQDLNDPEKEIRLAAIASLGTLHATEALPALVDLLRDQDEAIKAAARKALGRINTESNSQEKMLDDYKKATNQHAEPTGPKK